MNASTSKKILAPLAVLLAAGALAVGSGATFTATSSTISSVTSGDLKLLNSKDGQAIFNLTNMKPGDVVTGDLTLTNTGSLPATFSLTETASTNAFTQDMLTLVITDSADKPVFTGNFGDLVDNAKKDLRVFAPGDKETYTFTVALDQDATNAEQGKTANASYTWDAVQLSN